MCIVFTLSENKSIARGGAPQTTQSSQFELNIAKTSIKVRMHGKLSVTSEALQKYVKESANAVIAYYGRFPISKLEIDIYSTDDGGVGLGVANYDSERSCGTISLELGPETNVAELNDSWTLTHEMLHLGFPLMIDKHSWLAEGIATYAEPIGRMRVGQTTRERLWKELIEDCPKGQPRSGDKGLNQAHTIDRIYWGGAIYCLLADIEMRKQTKNKAGLETALRAIANNGGDIASEWSAEKAITVGDRAIGLRVLKDLYNRMALRPETVDLGKIWKELGIKVIGGRTVFDDDAPLASIRKAIEHN